MMMMMEQLWAWDFRREEMHSCLGDVGWCNVMMARLPGEVDKIA